MVLATSWPPTTRKLTSGPVRIPPQDQIPLESSRSNSYLASQNRPRYDGASVPPEIRRASIAIEIELAFETTRSELPSTCRRRALPSRVPPLLETQLREPLRHGTHILERVPRETAHPGCLS